jgi:Mn2+/Fe2+ NRAMP family transporter
VTPCTEFAFRCTGCICWSHNQNFAALQTRAYARTTPGKKQAIFYGTWDVSLSLMVAFFVNAAILITAAG